MLSFPSRGRFHANQRSQKTFDFWTDKNDVNLTLPFFPPSNNNQAAFGYVGAVAGSCRSLGMTPTGAVTEKCKHEWTRVTHARCLWNVTAVRIQPIKNRECKIPRHWLVISSPMRMDAEMNTPQVHQTVFGSDNVIHYGQVILTEDLTYFLISEFQK